MVSVVWLAATRRRGRLQSERWEDVEGDESAVPFSLGSVCGWYRDRLAKLTVLDRRLLRFYSVTKLATKHSSYYPSPPLTLSRLRVCL